MFSVPISFRAFAFHFFQLDISNLLERNVFYVRTADFIEGFEDEETVDDCQ